MTVPTQTPVDEVRYYVCDLVTGNVLDSLPLSGDISKAEGDSGTQAWSIAVNDRRMPPDWLTLLQPLKTMIVAEYRDRLVQAWIIVGLKVGGYEVEINGATLERALERVFVRDGEWFSVDEAEIAAGIAGQVLVPDGGWEVRWTLTGALADASHNIEGAITVKSAFETLAATETGPRYICDVEWDTPGARAQKVLKIGHTLGTTKPLVVFEGAMIDSYARTFDWSGDYAALRVWGATEGVTGTGVTPSSYASAKLDVGWHPWEAFVSFTDLGDVQLEQRASAALAAREDGAIVWEAVCHIDYAPQLLADWDIGDTVTIRAAPSQYDPIGGEISAEVVGWTLSPDARTITPTLVQETDEDGG